MAAMKVFRALTVLALMVPLLLSASLGGSDILAAEKGYLFIESIPAGADIVLDGQASTFRTTPALCTLSVGKHTFTIYKQYYESKSIEVEIHSERVERRKIHFVRLNKIGSVPVEDVTVYGDFGQLTIITDLPGATVYIDSVKVKTETPVTLNSISTGPHNLRLVYDQLVFDTLLIVPQTSPITLFLELGKLPAKETNVSSERASSERVRVRVVLLPSRCEYSWKYKGDEIKSFKIKGVDPLLTIEFGEKTWELTHDDIGLTNIIRDDQGRMTSALLVDSNMEFNFLTTILPTAMIEIDLSLLVSEGSKRSKEDDCRHILKKYSIPAGLNNGGDVNIRLRIEPDGEVIMRYW